MEDLEKKMTNTSYEDDIFDIDIMSTDPDEPKYHRR